MANRTDWELNSNQEKHVAQRGREVLSKETGESHEQEDQWNEQTPEKTKCRVPARLLVRFGPEANILSGYSVNLSNGGLFLETNRPLSVDEPLTLEIEIPDTGRKINCRGRVAWVNHPDHLLKSQIPLGMGIQFLNLTLENLEILREFIKKRALSAHW